MAMHEITASAASERLAEYDIIDVRSEEEFDGDLGHVEGSRLIPLPELVERTHELDARSRLLLVCRSGNRSGQACDQLAKLGFADVTNLVGGMLAWNEAGLPVSRAPDR